MNEISLGGRSTKFSEERAVTFGRRSKVRPVVFNRADHKPETHCQTVEQPRKCCDPFLSDRELLLFAKGQRSSRATLKIPFEHSSSLRVAPKSWSISSGSQANQSSRTVRERWPARLARKSP